MHTIYQTARLVFPVLPVRFEMHFLQGDVFFLVIHKTFYAHESFPPDHIDV